MSITATKTWVDAEILTHTDLNARFVNIEDQTLPAATQSEVNAMTSTSVGLHPNHNKIVLGTQVATTSGTTVTFSSIPAGVRKVTINPVGMSTGGTSDITVTLGDVGGLETSGYSGSVTTIAGASPTSNTFANAFVVTDVITAASTLSGTITLTLENSSAFTWVLSSVLASGNTGATHFAAGSKSLTAELDRIQISSVSGDTFDAGAINVTYER